MADLRSPQYLTVRDNYANICAAIAGGNNVTTLAQKLVAKKIIGQNVLSRVIAGVSSGQDPSTIAGQLMQNVHTRISFSPNSFYDFVRALDESELPTPIGDILMEKCRESDYNDPRPIEKYNNLLEEASLTIA